MVQTGLIVPLDAFGGLLFQPLENPSEHRHQRQILRFTGSANPDASEWASPMKSILLRGALLGLSCPVLSSPPEAHASSPPADSVHFCAFDDYEQWRRHHPRPAAKRLADLNAGEPRTVRMIYFLPNDWPYRAEVVDSMKTVIKQSQSFYREQMQAHGYGDWTFRIETDALDEPLVHHVDGQHPFSHYDNTLGTAVVAELEQTFDLDANIYFIVLGTDALRQGNGQPAGGVGWRRTKNGASLVVPDGFGFFTVAHELGHTFGLYHDFRDNLYIMSYGFDQRGVLSACAAEFLSVHTYFNSAIPIVEGQPPTVEITSPRRYQPGTRSVPVQLQVRDSEGLHQVSLIGNAKPCRGLAGEGDAVVEFDYDGSFWERGFTNLSDQPRHHMLIVAVDGKGNVSETNSSLSEISPYEIATLRGHSGTVESLAFSPDGTLLASGSERWSETDATVRLWDVARRKLLATLQGPTAPVAFSPDGATLASGSGDEPVQLWDLTTRREIATLEGGLPPIAFSPDGTILASRGVWGISLWNVTTQEQIATLKGHTEQMNSVAFSPDGTTLASASLDRTIKLWDLEGRVEIATFEVPGDGVWDMAWSPDGKTIASATFHDGIQLWDVKTREQTASLEEGLLRVAFSPDGSILAGIGWNGTVIWDLFTREVIITLSGHTNGVRALAFSPDGAAFATGSYDQTVKLWDVSEWTGPRPFALEIISGDGQQGTPGALLAQPLVVEVRDQYGDLLPDAEATFTVTAGEGKLSGRFTVEHVTTDANGRAALTLTLGPNPGQNIIGVSLGGREVAMFIAEGVGIAVAELDGDYRTWHLPKAATVRLGKGALGESDRAVALSADGRCLAVASAIGLWLYEAATSQALALLPTESAVHSVAFSLDGTLAAGLDNGQVELWEVETGERIGTLRHADWDWGGVRVAFSPDGTRLASGSLEQIIKVWDVETRRVAGTWRVARESDSYWDIPVAFSPDGTRLVSGFQDGTVRLWDVATQTEVATLEGHTDRVTSVAFSPDGALLASAGGPGDRTVILWDAGTQSQVATLRGHAGQVRSVAFSSPDGATLASGGWDRTVRLWDVATHEEVATFEEHGDGIRSVTFSRDGATLVSGAADGTVLLRDLETGNAAGLTGHGSLSSMALSPDGTLLASGYPDGTVRLWDAATRRRISTLKGHTDRVAAVSFSPDGSLLATAGGWQDKTIKLWDVSTRELIGTLEGHTAWVAAVSFSPDGALLASAGGYGDRTVKLWDVAARELIGTLEGHTTQVAAVSFSPDGALLASAGYEDKTVKLWDVASRELIGTLEGHEYEVNPFLAVAFSPDGKTLASGSADSRVRLWDVATRTHIATLQDRNTVGSVAFSPDGQSLVSGSWGTVKLWDVMTKKSAATLEGHTGLVHSVAFSRDGTTLATGAQDGTMLLWEIQLLQPRPHTLTKVSSVEQQVPAGSQLSAPFVVTVLDQNGDLLAGATVTFSITAGGGTLSVTTATTDANGRAATTLTLGRDPGRNTVTARVGDLKPVIFSATGLAIPKTLTKLSGHDQQGPAGAALPKPFLVEVRDQNNNPLEGTTVTFAVTGGGGTLSSTTATTDANGRAAATLTLGRDPGRNTVAARVAELKPVIFSASGLAIPTTLTRISGGEQQGVAGTALPEPFVVEVRDQNGNPLEGAEVTFAVTAGEGMLSAATATTDANGYAATTLTLGREPETVTVVATVAGLDPVTFTATAEATADFDGDGETGFSDFFLFADAFGGSDPRFDLDGSGSVDFGDFFLLADYFADPARGKLLALAREMIGLPDGPQLQQNAPNPFNSGTVITWFLLRPGAARVEVFALTGQRVAVLQQGPKKAGVHRVHWDGRDDEGRPLASGVYLYRLVTPERVHTRKLTLLR